jgi:hypothetical protein
VLLLALAPNLDVAAGQMNGACSIVSEPPDVRRLPRRVGYVGSITT